MIEGGTSEITGLGLSSYPAIIIKDPDGNREIFTEKIDSREEMTNFILEHLKLNRSLSLMNILKESSQKQDRLSHSTYHIFSFSC